MALAYGGGPVPSTGIGNIGNIFGAPNSPGAVGPAPNMPRANAGPMMQPNMGAMMQPNMGAMMRPMPMQPPSQPPMVPPGAGFLGIGNAAGAMQPHEMGGPMAGGGIAGIFGAMNPQHAAAIRGIPQEAMMALHRAGMIHPDLMRHLYGGAQL